MVILRSFGMQDIPLYIRIFFLMPGDEVIKMLFERSTHLCNDRYFEMSAY